MLGVYAVLCMIGVCTVYNVGTGADGEGVPEGYKSTQSG